MEVDGLADDLAATDDDDVLARGVVTVADEHLAYTCRSRGGEPLATLGQEADVEGVEGVHVLQGVDGLDDGILIDVIWQWQLDEDAVDVRVVAESTYLGYKVFLGRRVRHRHVAGGHAGLGGGAVLVADIDTGGGVFADEDDGQVRHEAVFFGEVRDVRRHLATHFGRNLCSVDNLRAHVSSRCHYKCGYRCDCIMRPIRITSEMETLV